MTKKTVKQIVDEYKNRQENGQYESITFEHSQDLHIESYSKVSNIYRDGIEIKELELDDKFHEYQLDWSFEGDEFLCIKPSSLRVVFRGRVVRFTQRIEE